MTMIIDVVSKHKDVSLSQRHLLQPGKDRPGLLPRRHERRANQQGQVGSAQHRRLAVHSAAQNHLARFHSLSR